MEAIEPHWEHGYRCHGYWLGLQRVGCVTLPSNRVLNYKRIYSAYVDTPLPYTALGERRTLPAAKRLVEKAYRTKS